MAHYGQIINSKKFQYFNYGCEKNKIIYNQNTCEPPLIPLEKIKLDKIAVFYSPGDVFCGPKDLEVLKKKLSGEKICKIKIKLKLIFIL